MMTAPAEAARSAAEGAIGAAARPDIVPAPPVAACPTESRVLHAPAPMRFDGDHPLLFSIHIPKTAGTRFRHLLSRVYGDRLALWYAPHQDTTHPLLRIKPNEFNREVYERLVDAGIKVVHGHFPASRVAAVVPEPERYCAWLREPIGHALSHYHFLRAKPDATAGPAALVQGKNLSFDGFLELPVANNLQSRYLDAFPIDAYGFVGVSELFGDLLPEIGLQDRAVPSNVNPRKPLVDVESRMRIVNNTAADLALYSYVLERNMLLLGRRAAPAQSPLMRTIGAASAYVQRQLAAVRHSR